MLSDNVRMLVKDEETGRAVRASPRGQLCSGLCWGDARCAAVERADELALLETSHGGGQVTDEGNGVGAAPWGRAYLLESGEDKLGRRDNNPPLQMVAGAPGRPSADDCRRPTAPEDRLGVSDLRHPSWQPPPTQTQLSKSLSMRVSQNRRRAQGLKALIGICPLCAVAAFRLARTRSTGPMAFNPPGWHLPGEFRHAS